MHGSRGFSIDIDEFRKYYESVVATAEPTSYFDNGAGYVGWSITSRDGSVSDGVRRLEMNSANLSSVRGSTVATPLYCGAGKTAIERFTHTGLDPIRIRIMKLENEGREMTFHRDAKKPAWRVHVPILTNPECYFEWELDSGEIERVHLPADGSAWFVRVDTLHRAVNDSPNPSERVHMIMSLAGKPDPALFDGSEHPASDHEHPAPSYGPMEIRLNVGTETAADSQVHAIDVQDTDLRTVAAFQQDSRRTEWSRVNAENRKQLLHYLPKHGVGCEIGVFKGQFSRALIDIVQPRKLHLIDPWVPQDIRLWKDKTQRFHLDSMRQAQLGLAQEIANRQVIVHQGFSVDLLGLFPANYFDWVYLDGDHRYESVRLELELCDTRVKQDGLTLGHDFIKPELYPPKRQLDFQVVQAVCDFCATHSWDLVFQTPDQPPGSKACPTFVLQRR